MAKKQSDKMLIPVMLIIFFAFLSFMFLSYLDNSNLATGFFGKNADAADVESPDPKEVATYSDTVFIIIFIIALVILLEYRRRKKKQKT